MDLLDDENVGARTVSRPKETAIDRAGRPMYGSDGRKLSIPERNYAFRLQELEQELQALRGEVKFQLTSYRSDGWIDCLALDILLEQNK